MNISWRKNVAYSEEHEMTAPCTSWADNGITKNSTEVSTWPEDQVNQWQNVFWTHTKQKAWKHLHHTNLTSANVTTYSYKHDIFFCSAFSFSCWKLFKAEMNTLDYDYLSQIIFICLQLLKKSNKFYKILSQCPVTMKTSLCLIIKLMFLLKASNAT